MKSLITVGSQVPYFYEIDALQSLRYDVPLPRHVPPWLNIYDLRDFLSYICAGVFKEGVQDLPVDSKQPFPHSHGAYWSNDGGLESHQGKVIAMAAMAVDPQKTYALVVGVEKYAAGSNWDLDGPTSDANKFVEWLRGRQVPVENIFYVSLSPRRTCGHRWIRITGSNTRECLSGADHYPALEE